MTILCLIILTIIFTFTFTKNKNKNYDVLIINLTLSIILIYLIYSPYSPYSDNDDKEEIKSGLGSYGIEGFDINDNIEAEGFDAQPQDQNVQSQPSMPSMQPPMQPSMPPMQPPMSPMPPMTIPIQTIQLNDSHPMCQPMPLESPTSIMSCTYSPYATNYQKEQYICQNVNSKCVPVKACDYMNNKCSLNQSLKDIKGLHCAPVSTCKLVSSS